MTACRYLLCTALTGAVFCFPVRAEVSVDLSAGLEYDSNVAVDPVDLTSGLGDVAQTLKLALGYEQNLGSSWEVNGSYRLSDSQWQTYSEYDTRLHIGSLGLKHRSGRRTADLTASYAQAELAGQPFLQLQRLTPAVGWLINREWYWRNQLNLNQKRFSNYPDRDSDGVAVRSQLFRFFDRTRYYLSCNGMLRQESANNDIYSYQAGGLNLALKRDWHLWGQAMTTTLSAGAEQREYVGVRSDIGQARSDWRYQTRLENQWQLTGHWQLALSLGYDDLRSNLDAANYHQYQGELTLSWGL